MASSTSLLATIIKKSASSSTITTIKGRGICFLGIGHSIFNGIGSQQCYVHELTKEFVTVSISSTTLKSLERPYVG